MDEELSLKNKFNKIIHNLSVGIIYADHLPISYDKYLIDLMFQTV